MGREILFRAWCEDSKQYLKGDFSIGIESGEFRSKYGEVYKNVIIEQFTGLTDKNGVKIFEGDILRKPAKDEWEKLNFVSYEVFFHGNDYCESSVGFQMNRNRFNGSICGSSEYYKFIPKNTIKFEVIRNIHDL